MEDRHPWTTVKGRGEFLALDKLGYNFVEVWLCSFGKYEPIERFERSSDSPISGSSTTKIIKFETPI